MFCFLPRIAAVILLVVAGTLAPAAAEDRAFKATGAGNIGHNGEMYARFDGTHLGKATFNGFVDLDSAQYPGILEIPAYLTAANGDRLYLDSVVDYDVDYDTYIGIGIGTLTIKGGSGRFQDATGSADVTFVFDFSVQNLTFMIDGSIDY